MPNVVRPHFANRLLPLLIGALVGVLASEPAWAEDCSATDPWINEVDYDSNDGFPNDDRDEFVEIAAPAGTDLSGYRVLSIEGNSGLFSGCLSGLGQASNGNAHWEVTIPGGTILADDTGTGVGLFVVCFDNTSANVVTDGDCDVVLPAPNADSNLKNGNLATGGTTNCPDGVLLLESGGVYVDAVSWEGLIPNTGSYGPFFHPPYASYNAGEDDGFTHGDSLWMNTSAVGKATSPAEWTNSQIVNIASPGDQNPGQALDCTLPSLCGDGVVEGLEECDDGNVTPEDGCSGTCLLEFCGDGVLQGGLGEQCDDGNTTPLDGCSDTCQVENEVPTLGEWSVLGLVLILLAVGSLVLLRTREGVR